MGGEGAWNHEGSPFKKITKTAFALDMSMNYLIWERKPSFDNPEPILNGFICQLTDFLYCMTLATHNFITLKIAKDELDRDKSKMGRNDKFTETQIFKGVSPFVTDAVWMYS